MSATVPIGIAVIAVFGGIAWYLRGLKPGLISLQCCYTRARFLAVCRRWPQHDLDRVRRHFLPDYLLIALYAAFGLSLAGEAGALASPVLARAGYLLPVAAVCDIVENVLHQWLLGDPRQPRSAGPYLIAGLASTAKWLLIAMSCVMAGIALMAGR